MKQHRKYGMVLLSVLLVACGSSEPPPPTRAELTAEANRQAAEAALQEQIAHAQAQAEAEAAADGGRLPFEVKLPPPPSEPTETPAQIAQMTNQEQVARFLIAKSAEQRMAAVHQLEVLASKSPLPDSALQRLINVFDADSDKAVSGAAAHALGQICHPAVMVSLQNNLHRELSDINPETIKVLGEVSGYRVTQVLDDFVKQLEGDRSPLAGELSAQAAAAKAAILARGGRPPKCTW